MLDFIISHKIIVAVIGLLVAVGVWIGLSTSAPSSSVLTTETVDNSGVDQELVATLLALRAVRLDGAIFSDPAFQSLKDFSTEIIPEPIGRPNPFAPIGSSLQVTSGSRGAQVFSPTGGR
jgi:hypothetical protein